MSTDQLTKQQLYESVKLLIESPEAHIHLNQHKLYTLVSIAFQYLLFQSTKDPGYYIIRTEDHQLLDKLARKAKDPSTRKFLDRLGQTRRLKYGGSTFYLDYFQMSTWAQTNDLPKERIKAAMVVKNASPTPLSDSPYLQEITDLRAEGVEISDFNYLSVLQEFVPKTISIAFEVDFPKTEKIHFPFIKKDDHKGLSGVKISKDVNFEDLN